MTGNHWPAGSKRIYSVVEHQIAITYGVIIDETPDRSALVVLNYAGIPGNRPEEYGNWAGFWRGEPCESRVLGWAPARSASPKQVIIEIEPVGYGYYVGGYCTGDPGSEPPRTLAASIEFRGESVGKMPFSSSILPIAATSGELEVSFRTPNGNNPEKNHNAIVLWKGPETRFDCHFESSTPVKTASPSGSQRLPISLGGGTYTLGYQNGPKCSDVSAACTFSIEE